MTAYFDTGFSVREPMWHGLGTVLDDYPETWEKAREIAGLTWDAIEQPVYTLITLLAGSNIPKGAIAAVGAPDGFQNWFVPASEHKGIVRSDTGKVLGVQSNLYSIVSIDDMGELAEGVMGLDKAVRYETLISIREGRNVAALLRLDEPVAIAGDDSLVYPFLAITNTFDGSGACKAIVTDVRIVCWNTFQLADQSEWQVSIRHAGNTAERIEEAKQLLANARAGAAAYAIAATELVSINVTDGLVQTFLDGFIPIPENASEQTRNARAARQATFLGIYNASPTTDGIRGTAYGLMQTMGEYLDHMRPYRSRDTYLSRTMLRPEPIKAQAAKAICKLIDRKDLLVLAGGRP